MLSLAPVFFMILLVVVSATALRLRTGILPNEQIGELDCRVMDDLAKHRISVAFIIMALLCCSSLTGFAWGLRSTNCFPFISKHGETAG